MNTITELKKYLEIEPETKEKKSIFNFFKKLFKKS